MRVCFELLEMLKAPKKAIRRASVNTFGYIAKAIGPQDVLHTLLNNLKVGLVHRCLQKQRCVVVFMFRLLVVVQPITSQQNTLPVT